MPGFNLGTDFPGSCHDGSGLTGAESLLPNTTETARRHRFRLTISTEAIQGSNVFLPDIVQIACESIDRPILRISKERVYQGADYINVPLRGEYDPVVAVFYEVEGFDTDITVKALMAWWTASSFDFVNSKPGRPEDRRANVVIEQLNGVGDPIWTYILHRCWPEIVSPDNLSYKSSDVAKTQLTLNFDKCEEFAGDRS